MRIEAAKVKELLENERELLGMGHSIDQDEFHGHEEVVKLYRVHPTHPSVSTLVDVMHVDDLEDRLYQSGYRLPETK